MRFTRRFAFFAAAGKEGRAAARNTFYSACAEAQDPSTTLRSVQDDTKSGQRSAQGQNAPRLIPAVCELRGTQKIYSEYSLNILYICLKSFIILAAKQRRSILVRSAVS